MDRTPCFHTLAATAHAAAVDRLDAQGGAIDEELRNDMQRALAGLQGHVPSYITNGTRTREVLSSAADEVLVALDYMECAEALMLALKDSKCPLVAKLRGALIERYVRQNADELLAVRGRA